MTSREPIVLECVVTLILLAAVIVALIGVTSWALLFAFFAPGAAAAFAAGVTASRMGADPLVSLALAFAAFFAVTALMGRLTRSLLLGIRQLLGWGEGRAA